jgi:hypothetical protein
MLDYNVKISTLVVCRGIAPLSRPIGRPRQRWQEDVMEDLKKLKVKNWKETAKDRRIWRDLAEKAKTHKGLYCQMVD